MSDINDVNIDGLNYVTETYNKRGRTRYYTRDPNNFFSAPEAAQAKQPDFEFLNLSPEHIAETIQKRRKEKEEYKDKYLVELSEHEHNVLNLMLEKTDKPEEKIYEFATAIKYAQQFNLPLDFAYKNLEAINKNWLGVGIAPSKSNFKAVVDSFSIGANILKAGDLGNALMQAELSGNKREIQYALKDLQRIEDENMRLNDTMPRSWLVNLFKSGAQAIPFQAASSVPSMITSAIATPFLGGAVSFAISSNITTGTEYWELRKAGVKPELAKNVAIASGAIQGLIETSLGNAAGFIGKGFGADKIASKVLTRLNAKGTFGALAKGLSHYGVNLLEEGVEEAVQELVSAGSKELAAVLQGEGVQTDDAQTIAGNVWESFKGGIGASVILGIPGAIKFTKANVQEAGYLKQAAIVTPSQEAFIKENKTNVVFEGMTEEDAKTELKNIYDAQKTARERFQRSNIQDYNEWLSQDARIEGEVVTDDEGNVVYETDEDGNYLTEKDEAGNSHKIEKRYGKASEVVRHGERLYITEGKKVEKANGIIEGEYIAGDPTQETEYNDYGHIYYSFNKGKNTVTIKSVQMMSDEYSGIIKEFVRDFGEKFEGARIEWNAKGETLKKIKAELIAENPRGKESGLQYFADTEAEETRANIKLHDRLKETMPQLNDTERHTAVSIFNAIAHGAGMDTETYLNTYYADEILTNTAPSNMEAVAAQENIDTKDIQGTTEFKEIANDIKALVYVSEKSDFSTFVHEAAHVARRTMKGDLLRKAEAAFDIENGRWTRADEEAFARGFEQYLKEGTAPTAELKSVFQKAAEFLARIYKSLKEIIGINDDIRSVYDELLGKDNSTLKQAEDIINETEAINKKAIKEFGRNYTEYYHKGIEAIEKVLKEKQGQVVGAFSRQDIGDIDVVWGNNQVGLQKIIDKHLNDFEPFGEAEKGIINGIAEIVNNGTLTEKNGVNTITYEKDNRSFRVGLTKGWDGKGENQWIITAYEENTGSGKGKTLSAVADLNSSQAPEETATHKNSITQNAETVNTEKTEKGKINEAYEKATQAAREAAQERIRAAEERKEDIKINGAQYEAETIEYYKKNYPGLNDEAIKAKIQEDAKKAHTSYEEFTASTALERRRLNEMGDVLFQTVPVTQEEIDFKKTAEVFRTDIDRYFTGAMKSNEVLTVTKRTPAILRAVGAPDLPITINQSILKKVQEKHPEITAAIIKTLPEQLTDPLAVFKSDNPKTPNNKVVFTEHIINGKPVIAAIEFNAERNGIQVNSVRSVYDKNLTAKNTTDILNEWVNKNLIEYIDDTRDTEITEKIKKDLAKNHDFGAPIAPVLDKSTSLSNTIIGENAENVNTGVLKKSDIIGDNPHAIYFQVEKEFYDEAAQAADKKTLKEELRQTVIGSDPAEASRFLYSSAEQAEYDTIYKKAYEAGKMLESKLGTIQQKDETFIKMLSTDKEALRSFIKQYVKAAGESSLKAAIETNGTKFLAHASMITGGHRLTQTQVEMALNLIKENTEFYRNVFAEINGYDALKSISAQDEAWIKGFADTVFKDAEKPAAKSRSEIQDELFLSEMDDAEKFNDFLKEAADIARFDAEHFAAQDAEDAAYRDEMLRKQARIDREMRNFSWKGTLEKVYRGEEPSARSISNIHAQIKNAARSYRSLYADIMEREDMRVKDAETTDAIIKTKLKSRPESVLQLDEHKLENMSNAEKATLLKALNNEELEQRVKSGRLTGEDINKIGDLIKAKNENIRDLEKQLKEAQEDNRDNTSLIFKLQEQIKNERINRKVLADTVKARDVAVKAIMKRVNLKTCDANMAEALAATQWFLKKDVQKALNATIDKNEPRMREAYALWKTSTEYRQTLSRMLGYKKGWTTLRSLLENKPIEDWTADDKQLAQRLIPTRNKFFSLGLYARTEKNFFDLKTADLTPAQIAEKAGEILPSEMLAKLKHQPLSQWTVDEMLDLATVIEEKYKEGKREFLSKKANEKAEAEKIRILGIKNFTGLKGYERRAAAWSDEEKKRQGGFGALRRKLKYAVMRPYAFMEMLDGGKRGILYDLMEHEQRERFNAFSTGKDKRLEGFEAFLEKNKITLREFDEKIVLKDFYIGKDKKDLTLTKADLIGVYVASFDEMSRAAVQYGNFAEQDEKDLAKSSDSYGALDSITEARFNAAFKAAEKMMQDDVRMKNFAEFLQAEYKAEGLRLYDHNKRVNNTITDIVDNYFPMLRLDGSGEEDYRQTQKKIIGEFAAGSRVGVEKGQTKARIYIGRANQAPIKLNAVTTYLQSVEANERLYAYDAYAQKLNRVVKGYGSQQFRRTLETAYGGEAVRYLDKQVNTIIDPTAGRVYSDSDKLLRVLRGNTAAAYLGFKLSGIIKQGLTSPAPFMQYVNPIHYTKAAMDLAIHRKEMLEFIYSRSKLMKHRSFDMMQNITEELAKEAKTKAGKALTGVQSFGMQGLEMIDLACVAPGWLAAFRVEEARLRKANTSLESPLTDLEIDEKATQWADDVLVRTQPSGRAEELAPLFREGGEALRLLLQFQSSLNVIYNNIRHDLPNAIKNKQYKRAAGIMTGYALAGIMTGLVTEGFGGSDDDEPETGDKIRKGVYFAFTQAADSVPVINGMVNGLAEKLITGKTSYRGGSSLYPAFEKAVQGTTALTDADIKKAAGKYAEAAALTLGLPTSGTKEALYAAEQVFNGEAPSALWGRR